MNRASEDLGRPRVEIARSLGLSDSTLANWMDAERPADAWAANAEGLPMTKGEELRALREEVIDLRTDGGDPAKGSWAFRPETTR